MTIKRSYSVMEIKNLLKASESTPLSPRTQGHAIGKHQQIAEIDLVMRQIDRPNLSVSAFAPGTKISDQFVAIAFLLNTQKGQQALGVLDLLASYPVYNKKSVRFSRVSLTGPVDTGPHISVPQRRVVTQGSKVPQVKQQAMTKMTLVLELPPTGFIHPFYLVTAYPNRSTDADKLNPAIVTVKKWIKKAHKITL